MKLSCVACIEDKTVKWQCVNVLLLKFSPYTILQTLSSYTVENRSRIQERKKQTKEKPTPMPQRGFLSKPFGGCFCPVVGH